MIEIKEFKEIYAKEVSEIIQNNLYKINIKDHGKEVIDKLSKHFTEEQIKKNFPNRRKCFVAIDGNDVVGTASIDKFRGDESEKKFIILTVFVKIEKQHQGIGKSLIEKIEQYAKNINAEELVILASIYGVEFYRKLGYDYLYGRKELNEDREYTLVKYL